MRGASRGQVGAEFGMLIAFLAGVAMMSVQFFGLALTSVKVAHAAQEAAYVAGSNIEAAGDRTPCWAVAGGLVHPDAYSDAAVCRTVLENLGDVNPVDVTVSVSPSMLQRTNHTPVHVTITYQQSIGSPLLRLLMGDKFRSTADATSWTN